MVIALHRTYFPNGTNGRLECLGRTICNTIELPWKNNERNASCITEGKYLLKKRHSAKYGWHLEVLNVKGRSLILFHPANYALTEPEGCIAPVTKISGAGAGLQSRKAFQRLKDTVFPLLDKNKTVLLVIKS